MCDKIDYLLFPGWALGYIHCLALKEVIAGVVIVGIVIGALLWKISLIQKKYRRSL